MQDCAGTQEEEQAVLNLTYYRETLHRVETARSVLGVSKEECLPRSTLVMTGRGDERMLRQKQHESFATTGGQVLSGQLTGYTGDDSVLVDLDFRLNLKCISR